MTTSPAEFVTRVAVECRNAADRLHTVQGTIGAELSSEAITERMVSELQNLDMVSQTLADLAVVFAKLASEMATGGDCQTATAIACAQQVSLRLRLAGVEHESDGGVELF